MIQRGAEQEKQHLHMDKILSWNMRGLNGPNKQEDVKIFLQQQKAGLVGLLETKLTM